MSLRVLGYNRELFVCPSCVFRVNIGRLRVCVGSILAFNQINDENRAKFKISYSCGHRVSKSARYDATLNSYNQRFIKESQQFKLVTSNAVDVHTETFQPHISTCFYLSKLRGVRT